MIETTGKYTQMLIFPEGATTNGTHMLKFKQGALISERTLQPMCLIFDTDNLNFSSAFDILPCFSLTILTLCKCSTFVKVLELPLF